MLLVVSAIWHTAVGTGWGKFIETEGLVVLQAEIRGTVHLSQILSYVLGMQPNKSGGNQGVQVNTVSVTLGQGDLKKLFPQTVFCYCSLVMPSIVGDRYSPLLKLVPHRETGGAMSYYESVSLEKKHLRARSFNTVTIELRDASGELIQFSQNAFTIVNFVFQTI